MPIRVYFGQSKTGIKLNRLEETLFGIGVGLLFDFDHGEVNAVDRHA